MDEIDDLEIMPGHVLSTITPVIYSGGGQYGKRYQVAPARYSCSCKEIADVDVDAAQAHVDELTP